MIVALASSAMAADVALQIPQNIPLPAAGSDIAVPVAMTRNGPDDVTSYKVSINYPADQLQFKSAANGAVTAGWGAPVVNANKPGIATVVNAGATPASGSGKLLALTFTVQAGAMQGGIVFLPATEINDAALTVETRDGSFGEGEGEGEGEGDENEREIQPACSSERARAGEREGEGKREGEGEGEGEGGAYEGPKRPETPEECVYVLLCRSSQW